MSKFDRETGVFSLKNRVFVNDFNQWYCKLQYGSNQSDGPRAARHRRQQDVEGMKDTREGTAELTRLSDPTNERNENVVAADTR